MEIKNLFVLHIHDVCDIVVKKAMNEQFRTVVYKISKYYKKYI